MIAASDTPRMNKVIDKCLTASIRCDASMDRTQKDNEMLLLLLIHEDGSGSLDSIESVEQLVILKP